MKQKPKRLPKNKEQLLEEVRTNQKIDHQRKIIRALITLDPKMKVSDFCNHVDVIAGLILQAQKEKTNKMLVSELTIDLKVKAAPSPKLLQEIYDLVKDEKAPDEISALLAKASDHIKYQIKEVAFHEKHISDISVEEMLR